MTTTAPTSDKLAALAVKIGPAAHTDRRDEQYPYLPRPGHTEDAAAIHDEVGQILASVESMIRKLIRKQFAGSEDERDEIAQACRIHLWTHSIARFDQLRGARLSTFLYQCIANVIRGEIRREARSAASQAAGTSHKITDTAVDGAALDNAFTARPEDPTLDRRIEAIAADVMGRPEEYVWPPARAGRFADMLAASPAEMQKDVAARLGFTNPTSFFNAIYRILKDLEQLNIEAWQAPPTPAHNNPRRVYESKLGWPICTLAATRERWAPLLSPSAVRQVDAVIASPDTPPIALANQIGISDKVLHRGLVLAANFINDALTNPKPRGSQQKPARSRLNLPAGFAHADAEAMRDDLSLPLHQTLLTLLDLPQANTGEIAEALGIQRPAAQRRINRLREKFAVSAAA